MQFLIYLFIFLIGFAIAAAVNLGLSFTPIESFLTGLVAVAISLVAFERTLRRRAEMRFEKGIEDLSRLLSTNAQAGKVLSKRLNKLTDKDLSPRLDLVEADISVFGTIVHQVAEAVAQLEEAQTNDKTTGNSLESEQQEEKEIIAPKISSAEVKKALDDGRITIYAQAIISLPKRQTFCYSLLPIMQLENGETAKSIDFMPVNDNSSMIKRIDQLALKRAFEYLENTQDVSLLNLIYVPISKSSLSESTIVEWIIAQLDISREKASYISLSIPKSQYSELSNKELINLTAMVEKGASICLLDVVNLRMDFANLKQLGVQSVQIDASNFIHNPEKYTDYQSSDLVPFIRRFNIDVIVDNIQNEQQILILLEDGFKFIMGDYIKPAKPALTILKTEQEYSLTAT